MGFLFSRPVQSQPATSGRRATHSPSGYGRRQPPTANDVESYIDELLELSPFFDELDKLTSGDFIPYKVAGEVLDLDEESMSSYLTALTMKADHLSGIRKYLASHRNVARADLLRELLDNVEPKCRQMREKLSRLRSSLVVESSSARRSTEDRSSTGSDDHSGPSGLSGSAPVSPPPTGSNQSSPAEVNRVGHSSTSQATGVPSLLESSDSGDSSGSGEAEEESPSEDEDDISGRRLSGSVTKLKDWRDQVSVPNAKKMKIIRSKNLLDQVVPWYANAKSKTLRRISAVTFVGESGTDMGALTREFFFIAFEAIIGSMFKSMRFLEGERGHLIPNAMADCRAFTYLGRMIVHAIINDCKGLPGLSPAIVHYLVSGKSMMELEDSVPPLHIDDVADPPLKLLLQKYENGKDFSELEEDAWMNWMAESNCQANWRSSVVRQYVIQQILLHYVFMKRVRQIQALEEGFKELGLQRFLVKNPTTENISEVFPSDNSTAYSPDTLEAIIITRGDDFDIATFELFKQFMQDLHKGNIADFRLSSLIQFVTSSPYLPERLVVSFNTDITIPVAHACYLEITLPLAHQRYPEFRTAMVTAFQNGLTGFQLQ